MALAQLALPKITFRRAAHYTEGRTEPVRAFVNHRMVGTVAGTDAYFTNPSTRPVSTHFGIGYGADGVVRISQYVPLDDTAYGNGNYDVSGNWDNWGFKTTEINPQTVSIEHQDYNDPAGRGVVSAKTQEASQKLQALLRYGTLSQWKAAGIIIRDWDHNAPILRTEIQKIVVDGRHIITHHDIAGKLKPYCWLPWQNDKVGFPRAAYVAAIKEYGAVLAAPAPVTPPVVPPVVPPVHTEADYQTQVALVTSLQSQLLVSNTANSTLTTQVKLLEGRIASAKAALG